MSDLIPWALGGVAALIALLWPFIRRLFGSGGAIGHAQDRADEHRQQADEHRDRAQDHEAAAAEAAERRDDAEDRADEARDRQRADRVDDLLRPPGDG